tara:strand:- start:1860 stop:1997 length:138 start_codon:yes stop_codon:yes gene_type:complete
VGFGGVIVLSPLFLSPPDSTIGWRVHPTPYKLIHPLWGMVVIVNL